jgi:hypothetical protein
MEALNELGYRRVRIAADELGRKRAAMAAMKAEIEELENEIKDSGYDVVEGYEYRVAISRDVKRVVVNWKKIAMDLGASNHRVAGNSKNSYSDRVRVSALKK